MDISNERQRIYTWPNGHELRIQRPTVLTVYGNPDQTFMHEVVDDKGCVFLITPGWRYVTTSPLILAAKELEKSDA